MDEAEKPSEETLARITIPSQPERLDEVRDLVRGTLVGGGCDGKLCNMLVLAVDEACSNVIRHGYGSADQGRIDLEIARRGEDLLFRVTDDARCVDPAILTRGPPPTLQAGGLGITFMRRVMDEVRYDPPSGGRTNLLFMRKRLQGNS